jgi:hypothetical protein
MSRNFLIRPCIRVYHLFERGSRKSLEKVKLVVDKSSTLVVTPKGGECHVVVLERRQLPWLIEIAGC